MKLIITQPEIEAIVRAHVENTVQLREGAEMKIDFTATRSDDGITATIDIPYMGVAGIPAIAEANEQAAVVTVSTPAKAQAKTRATKGNAAEVLGGGTTAATASAKNPEPATAPEAEETAQDAADEPAGDAPAEASDAAQSAAEPAVETAASSRGPSLFGSAFRAG